MDVYKQNQLHPPTHTHMHTMTHKIFIQLHMHPHIQKEIKSMTHWKTITLRKNSLENYFKCPNK